MLLVNPLKTDEEEIIYMAKAACHEIDHIYLHWTAGHYGQAYDDYHLNIDKAGIVYRTCCSLAEEKGHTWNGTAAVSLLHWTAGTGLQWRCPWEQGKKNCSA